MMRGSSLSTERSCEVIMPLGGFLEREKAGAGRIRRALLSTSVFIEAVWEIH